MRTYKRSTCKINDITNHGETEKYQKMKKRKFDQPEINTKSAHPTPHNKLPFA